MSAGEDRLRGWREALGAAGLADDALEHADFTERGGYATQALLARHPDLDDLMAAGALRVLAAAGRRVPHDIAVVGYDDLGVAETTQPPLTTIRNPIGPMAERATRLLLDQLDGTTDRTPVRMVVPPELVRRASA